MMLALIENYTNAVSQYHACKGALLEVAIAPFDKQVPISKYPYFADFDPKKRELYEVVTETGETMSRTQEETTVQKGGTTE